LKIISAFLILFLSTSASFADVPRPWQIGFQESASLVMDVFTNFHNMLLYVIFAIAIFVFILMCYVCIKFSKKNNPIPSKTTHNVLLEVLWTIVPVLILLAISVPSMHTLYYSDTVEDADLTLKVTGYQWYWGYQYPDNNIEEYTSYMIPESDLKPGDIRLLSVDNEVVLPVGKKIRIQTTAADVIHNWAVPAFAIKIDAVPGRLNETWVQIKEEGTYYGQCSELCGKGHGFMPIQIRAVSESEFDKWVKTKQQG
jgi:cytochrome c oxidase subunit 2